MELAWRDARHMSLQRIPDPAAYERANFRMALR